MVPAEHIPETVALPDWIEQWRDHPLVGWLVPMARSLSGLRAIDRLSAQALADPSPACGPGERFLRTMRAKLEVDPEEESRLPTRGPLIVVANHPFGFLDALGVLWLLDRNRTDVRVLANEMLSSATLARERSLFVDVFESEGGVRSNARALRSAIEWVEGGGCLVVFPAGEVSALSGFPPKVADRQWNPLVARLVSRTGATVVPLFTHGRNSALFQVAGLLHPLLRTALLPRELLAKHGASLRISVGMPIPKRSWAQPEAEGRLIDFLRARTELLGRAMDERQDHGAPDAERPSTLPPTRPSTGLEELRSGPVETLFRHGDWRLVAARGRDIPLTMREVGRLREISFRAVGEGTGREVDVDRFDDHYWQLLLLDEANGEVVGGYRLGLSEEILAAGDVDGFYTHTLFEFSRSLLDTLGPSLELGRSFVRLERQRDVIPLHLLWKGIGSFIARRPQYRRLFGPVSISSEFSSMSKALLARFVELNSRDARLASLVAARTPPSALLPDFDSETLGMVAKTVDEVDELVSQFEHGKRRMPPLIRQYLRLNAKLLAFNVDREFSDCLDALLVVDLLDVDRRILRKYLGESMESYLRAHRVEDPRASA